MMNMDWYKLVAIISWKIGDAEKNETVSLSSLYLNNVKEMMPDKIEKLALSSVIPFGIDLNVSVNIYRNNELYDSYEVIATIDTDNEYRVVKDTRVIEPSMDEKGRTDKFNAMIEAFECDFVLCRDGNKSLNDIESQISSGNKRILKDIELLEELSWLLKNGKAEIRLL